MKRSLFLSAIVAILSPAAYAAEWNEYTTGDQTISEDVTVTGTANVGNITFNGNSTVSGTGTIGGSGNLTVSSGTVVFDGVSRPASEGNITIAAGATLEVTNGAQILNTNHNFWSTVNVSGTLKVEDLNYGGSLGSLRDNTDYTEADGNWGIPEDTLILNGSDSVSPRVEITESGSASIGARLNGYGSYFTFAVAEEMDFEWQASTHGVVYAGNEGAGSVLVLEAGADATFTMGKRIDDGLTISKKGDGTLVLDNTVNLSAGRRISLEEGTTKFGDNFRVESAGDGIFVYEGATLDMEDQALTYDIHLNEGGLLANAADFRGNLIIGAEVIDYAEVENYGGTLVSAADEFAISLSQDTEISGPTDYTPYYGRINTENSLYISGANAEEGEAALSISGFTTVGGAVNAGGDITISEVTDITLSGNNATAAGGDEFQRAGALNSAGCVIIYASGDIEISDNNASKNYDSAGAIYGASTVVLEGASINISDNSVGIGDAGAIKSGDSISLNATDGSITITGNTAEVSGGALYSSWGVDIAAATDITISNNIAITADGGAIYSDDAVTITAGTDGTATISENYAGGYGGAIYSYETVTLSGGEFNIHDNTAEQEGGAIYAASVDISADAGNITFSNNTDGDGANDVTIEKLEDVEDAEYGRGKANLSATNGYSLTMHGGIRGAYEMNISTDADSVVQLGGTNSAYNLYVAADSTLAGIASEEGECSVITFTESATIEEARLKDICLNGDYSGSLSFTDSTIELDNGTLLTSGDENDGGGALTLSFDVPLIDAAAVSGSLTLNLTEDFLAAALALDEENGVNIIIQLTGADVEGELSFTLSQELVGILDASAASYGIYNADGDLLGINDAYISDALYGTTFVINNLSAVVPEPGTATLSLLALAALAARRRRK